MMGDASLPAEMSLQDAAINLLTVGYSISEAARILDVEPSTVRRWWSDDPLFKLRIEALKEQAISDQTISGKAKRQ
jgi:transposase-like protein